MNTYTRLPVRLDAPLLRRVFKPGIVSRQLKIPFEDVIKEILWYHNSGSMPCWMVQYDRPDLPDSEGVDWSRLYARSTERYDHLKLKWWAYRSIQLHYQRIIGHPPPGIRTDLGMESTAFHPKLISDVFLANRYGFPLPKVRPTSICVECGDTEADKLLILGANSSSKGMMFCVMPYFLMDSSIALVFYLGSRLVESMMDNGRMPVWWEYCQPSVGVRLEDGMKISAWGEIRV